MSPDYPNATVLTLSDDDAKTVVRFRLAQTDATNPPPSPEPTDPVVDVKIYRYGVEIRVEGYEEASAAPGWGDVVLLERNEKGLTLYVWADVNKEDPTHVISLEGARAENLKPENRVRRGGHALG